MYHRSEVILQINQTGVIGVVVFEPALVGQSDFGLTESGAGFVRAFSRLRAPFSSI